MTGFGTEAMTKKDTKALLTYGGLGLGALLAVWFFARQKQGVLVVDPSMVKWEGESNA